MTTEERNRIIYEARELDSYSYDELAMRFNMPAPSIRRIVSEYAKMIEYAETQSQRAPRHDSADYAYTRQQEDNHAVLPPERVFDGKLTAAAEFSAPLYNGWGRVESDLAIVIGDVHVPATDWDFASRVLEVAKRQNIRDLFIIGDLMDFAKISVYPQIVPPAKLRDEYIAARYLMESWLSHFDRIILRMGNHDHRLWKMLGGDMSMADFQRTIGALDDKVDANVYTQVEIVSGGQLWRATHQRNYSRNKGIVASELALQFQCNIISAHQHHAAFGMDRYGRYAWIDNGGLFDYRKMAHVMLADSLSPVMTQGFTVLRDGVGHLLTPYRAMTDWSMWL